MPAGMAPRQQGVRFRALRLLLQRPGPVRSDDRCGREEQLGNIGVDTRLRGGDGSSIELTDGGNICLGNPDSLKIQLTMGELRRVEASNAAPHRD